MKRLLCYFGFHKWVFDWCEMKKAKWTVQHYHCANCSEEITKPYDPGIDWHRY